MKNCLPMYAAIAAISDSIISAAIADAMRPFPMVTVFSPGASPGTSTRPAPTGRKRSKRKRQGCALPSSYFIYSVRLGAV